MAKKPRPRTKAERGITVVSCDLSTEQVGALEAYRDRAAQVTGVRPPAGPSLVAGAMVGLPMLPAVPS